MLPSPPNHPFVIEYVGSNSLITFYYPPTDSELMDKFKRYKLINCSCPAYARERQQVLPIIQQAILDGKLEPIPSNVDKRNYPVLRITA